MIKGAIENGQYLFKMSPFCTSMNGNSGWFDDEDLILTGRNEQSLVTSEYDGGLSSLSGIRIMRLRKRIGMLLKA